MCAPEYIDTRRIKAEIAALPANAIIITPAITSGEKQAEAEARIHGMQVETYAAGNIGASASRRRQNHVVVSMVVAASTELLLFGEDHARFAQVMALAEPDAKVVRQIWEGVQLMKLPSPADLKRVIAAGRRWGKSGQAQQEILTRIYNNDPYVLWLFEEATRLDSEKWRVEFMSPEFYELNGKHIAIEDALEKYVQIHYGDKSDGFSE